MRRDIKEKALLTGNSGDVALEVLLLATDQLDGDLDVGELLRGGPLNLSGGACGDFLVLGGSVDGVEEGVGLVGRLELGNSGGDEGQDGGGGELHVGYCGRL